MKSNKMLGAILIMIALFKIVIAFAILGNLTGFLLFATDLSLVDLAVGTLVLLVGLYLIRK